MGDSLVVRGMTEVQKPALSKLRGLGMGEGASVSSWQRGAGGQVLLHARAGGRADLSSLTDVSPNERYRESHRSARLDGNTIHTVLRACASIDTSVVSSWTPSQNSVMYVTFASGSPVMCIAIPLPGRDVQKHQKLQRVQFL